ncbi:SLC13 family permease [Gimibacter soli]|uniref:SLC13 family permease n=1 Tax=Gimibacter soli TaxID=3024400 RepID=A0AAE9XPL4_9PROT|nr:SLC13 family permease [Gimibacter soli]WCL54041.1 SLC13 family permease [Gimibacter soli]
MTSQQAPAAAADRPLYQRIGLVAGPLLFALILLMDAPEGMSDTAWKTVAVAALMAAWWATEAIPLPVTSLLPIVMLPMLDVVPMKAATGPYAAPVIFLLMGGFIAAMAMQRWHLHRRIALTILSLAGDKPGALIGGFMATSAILSMWISNTATALLVVPIAISVAETILGPRVEGHRFLIALLIGCAWSASIGGLGTYIGTPPNLFVKGFILDATGRDIQFLEWMAFAVPVVAVMVPLAWFVLTRICFRFDAETATGGAAVIAEERAAIGGWTKPERRVAMVMGAMAFAWSFLPFFKDALPFLSGVDDTHVAVAGAIAMFLVPSGNRDGNMLLDWPTAVRLPWGVILLFGGGLSLAAAVQATGLAEWLGTSMSGITAAPLILIMFSVTLLVIFLTELTSNTATVAALVPIMAALAASAHIDPLYLAAPVALAGSSAFMLPVATGPNAVVFTTGYLHVPDMVKAGLILNILGSFVITGLCFWLLPIIFP